MQTGLHTEAINGAIQARFNEMLNHAGRHGIGVQIDGRVHGFGGFKDGPKLGVRQVLAVGVRVNHNRVHAQLVHTTLNFFGGGGRVLGRHRNHADQAVGVPASGFSQNVVGHRGKSHRGFFVHDLNAGRCEANDLHIYTGFVHVLQA